MRIVAEIIARRKILYKALVLDLDGTLCPGTISEDGFACVAEGLAGEVGECYRCFMRWCVELRKSLGIYLCISSRNNQEDVERFIATLDEGDFPLAGNFDVLVANENPKSVNLESIAKDLCVDVRQLVLVDDSRLVRDEVRIAHKGIWVPDWENHAMLMHKLVGFGVFERSAFSDGDMTRIRNYHALIVERQRGELPDLRVSVHLDQRNVEAENLYRKSNQFRLSNRLDIVDASVSSYYFCLYDRTGVNLGVCCALSYNLDGPILRVQNWSISCRYFTIGLEEFIALWLLRRASAREALFDYDIREDNVKGAEFVAQYCEEAVEGVRLMGGDANVNRLRAKTKLKENG